MRGTCLFWSLFVVLMAGLGGCSAARSVTMAGMAYSDIPTIADAKSVERKIYPITSPTSLPDIEFRLQSAKPADDLRAWYQSELTKRG